MFTNSAILFIVVIAINACLVHSVRLTEDERVKQWYERGNVWPPNWQVETEAYKQNMVLREEELMRLPGSDERWENFMQYTAARMVPRFTPYGFKVIQTPPEIQAKLKGALDKALEDYDSIRQEARIDVLYTPVASRFVDIPAVSAEVHRALLPLHEEWAGGLKLIPSSIYGIRLNSNGSSLIMHYDKIFTHVISSIIHVGHEYDNDNEPWPIEIEDHDGNLHAVNLEAGQMLFYESAACLHGRRKVFKGKYYASIFAHYQPADRVLWNYHTEDVINNVPPHWHDGVIENHGSRHAGQGLTIDSRMSDAAPPRVIQGEVVEDIKAFYDHYHQQQALAQARAAHEL